MKIVRKRLIVSVSIIIALVLTGWLVLGTRQAQRSKLAVTFSHFETHHDVEYAVIKVTNVSARSASCYGYGWELPFYYVVSVSGTNWSWDYSPGFEWDKARPVKLQPGASMAVRTDVPIPEKWVVGIPYSDATTDETLPRRVWLLFQRFNPVKKRESIAWSETLTRRTKPTNIVPPLAAPTPTTAQRPTPTTTPIR